MLGLFKGAIVVIYGLTFSACGQESTYLRPFLEITCRTYKILIFPVVITN